MIEGILKIYLQDYHHKLFVIKLLLITLEEALLVMKFQYYTLSISMLNPCSDKK
tara:strand:- start:84 stop:245 length:162 start_codon:yes stop_codon:yes gene_type:complete